MSETAADVRLLDAAYKPFPNFEQWTAETKIDNTRWSRYKTSLNTYSSVPQDVLNRAREIAKRAAAIDTGALEDLYEVDRGFTFTVALESAAWEIALAKRGEQVRPLFEAQLHAYDYVLDLATKAEPITEASIRALHEVVCKAQDTYLVTTAVGPQEQPLPKGQYKSLANHVRTRKGVNHSYAPVDMTPMEMARLVRELRSEAFLNAHPVQQAAYSHYAFVLIHPFVDGNGRVSRALASAFTYRDAAMPIVILSEHKSTYLDSLEAADAGNFQTFQDFMLDRSLETMQMIEESLRTASIRSLAETLNEMASLYVTKGGYTHDDVDKAGLTLLKLILAELQKVIASNKMPKLNTNANIIGGAIPAHLFDATKIRPLPQGIQIVAQLYAPANANNTHKFFIGVPIEAYGSDDIVFRSHQTIEFTARVDELLPTPSGPLQIRIGMLAERLIGEIFSSIVSLAKQSIGRS